MDYISVKEAAQRWNVSERWIQKYCMEGRIPNVSRFGRSWMIPKDAEKPDDLRRRITSSDHTIQEVDNNA